MARKYWVQQKYLMAFRGKILWGDSVNVILRLDLNYTYRSTGDFFKYITH
jgi:hypothetical protein